MELSSRRHPLCFRLLSLLLPLADFILVDATQFEQLFFVVDHFLAARAGQRVILHQENGFLGAYFLAVTAEDAAEHVDLEFLRGFLDVAGFGRAPRPRRDDTNGFWWTNELAQLAGDAFGASLLVLDQIGRAAISIRNNPFLLGVLHRNLFPEEMAKRD